MSPLSKHCLIIAVLAAPPSLASAWQRNMDEGLRDTAHVVKIDASGDVITLGAVKPLTSSPGFSVLKFSGTDGALLWRTDISGIFGRFDLGYGLDVDSSGNVFAAGAVVNLDDEDFCVVKLAGSDGSVLWRHEIPGDPGFDARARAVVIDPVDPLPSVIAAGTIDQLLVVVKLSAADGSEVWRSSPSLFVGGEAVALAIDPAGTLAAAAGRLFDDFGLFAFDPTDGSELWSQKIDGSANDEDSALDVAVDAGDASVAAVGFLGNAPAGSNNDFFAVKFDALGSELWRQTIAGTLNRNDVASAVALDANGEVVAVGSVDNMSTDLDFTVVRLDPSTGDVLWRQDLDGELSQDDVASAVRVDDAGDVLVAGSFLNSTRKDFSVVKLAADGTELWRRSIDGDEGADERAVTLALQGDSVVAGGTTRNEITADDLTVVKLSSTDGSGADFHLFSGDKLVLRDNAVNPVRRRVRLASDGDILIPAGGLRDPTLTGATVELIHPITGEMDSYFLPAAQWTLRPATGPQTARYVYRDPEQVNGPCTRMAVTVRRGFRLSCRGSQIAYTLDEASQGGVSVRVFLGADPFPFCMHFGGRVLRDVPAMPHGLFRTVEAPAQSCLVP